MRVIPRKIKVWFYNNLERVFYWFDRWGSPFQMTWAAIMAFGAGLNFGEGRTDWAWLQLACAVWLLIDKWRDHSELSKTLIESGFAQGYAEGFTLGQHSEYGPYPEEEEE